MATNIVCLTTVRFIKFFARDLYDGAMELPHDINNSTHRQTNLDAKKAAPSRDAFLGVHGARETPVPIPNTAVKPSSGYNTWVLALGK